MIEVRDAIKTAQSEGRGIVALETAVLTHGLPYPDNLAIMQRMSDAVRRSGAVPAVIGVLAGRVVVGLSQQEWEAMLAGAQKCSIRDLGILLPQKSNGGTTVAATAYVARQVGIEVFATGGIGGVHRGVADTWDVSADLYAMAHLPIIIVSSGIKSILDIPKTMEFLESLGIPVLGYRTSQLPGFYVRESGIRVPHTVEQPEEAVAVHRAMRELKLLETLLVAQPGPQPVPGELVDRLLEEALHAAKIEQVSGKDTTPFLLGFLNREAGDILKLANMALLESNADLAGQIAAKLYV